MTVGELLLMLETSIAHGLDPDVAVVVEVGDWFSEVDGAHSPSAGDRWPEPTYDCWFTLTLGGPADSRLTTRHVPKEE